MRFQNEDKIMIKWGFFFCIFRYLARRKSHNNNSGSGYWERQITYDSYDQPADLEKTQRNNNECQLAGPFHVHPFVGRKINKIWIPWNTSRLRLHYDERKGLTLRNHATWRWPHQMNSFVQLLLYTLRHGNEQNHWQIICQRKKHVAWFSMTVWLWTLHDYLFFSITL